MSDVPEIAVVRDRDGIKLSVIHDGDELCLEIRFDDGSAAGCTLTKEEEDLLWMALL